MPYEIAALHGLVGKTRVDLSQNQYDRSYVDFAKRVSATFDPRLHSFNCEFWRLQPELASGGFCILECYSFSRIEQSYEVLKLSRRRNECQSMINFAVFLSLSVLGGYPTDSRLNGDIPAIASALTYSKHSQNKNLVIIPGKL